MNQKIILTFDLEYWYGGNFLKKYLPENTTPAKDYIIESIEPILDILDKYGHKATFFVLGQVAEKYPSLIKKLSDSGHEIASHGYSHVPLPRLDKEKLRKEIELTSNIIKNISGEKPAGFRAPNFSLNRKTEWALDDIKGNFYYDSSVHPLSRFRVKNSVREIYPSLGGIYFRILPLPIFILLVKLFSKQKPAVLYFHPYEFFDSTPKIDSAPWLKKKIKYWGTKTAWKKFEKLMNWFDFISIKQSF